MGLTSCQDMDGIMKLHSLEVVPSYYRYIAFSPKKAEAAQYLLDGMPYHTASGLALSIPEELAALQRETDALYESIVSGHTLADYPADSLRHKQDERRPLIETDTIPEAVCDYAVHRDGDVVTPRFLIRHINNAFRVWKRSPFARELTFDEFKEYILPYSSVNGYGFLTDGKEYARWFDKYVRSDTAQTARQCVEAYNKAVGNMRWLNGRSTREKASGIYDLYTNSLHDCVDIASYGCNILRACGLPTVVEYNVCYRNLAGRHYHCCVWDTDSGRWETFNPESSLPGDGDWAFAETMNVYRMTYAPQYDTPYFLKSRGEYVPAVLNDPCIKDVTEHLRPTAQITIPCHSDGKSRLAYLTTFSKEMGGLIPVTWGIVDSEAQTVTFDHALADVLYVLVTYEGRRMVVQSTPFYVCGDSAHTLCPIPGADYERCAIPDTIPELTLTRKYPRKPNMIQVAEELVGSRILGANKRDFSDAVTLLELTKAPQPYFLDYPLTRTGQYAYYRFQTAAEHPHANISMLEWVTEARRGYVNVQPATRPHCLNPSDTLRQYGEDGYVKLLDEESWEKMSWKAEYDGNMQTAPSAYPNITLWLKEPQVVTHVRLAPKNADNGIQSGDRFELLYWDDGWVSVGSDSARYEFVTFSHVPSGRIYWLKNLTRGKEELLFTLSPSCQQQFLYYDMLY